MVAKAGREGLRTNGMSLSARVKGIGVGRGYIYSLRTGWSYDNAPLEWLASPTPSTSCKSGFHVRKVADGAQKQEIQNLLSEIFCTGDN